MPLLPRSRRCPPQREQVIRLEGHLPSFVENAIRGFPHSREGFNVAQKDRKLVALEQGQVDLAGLEFHAAMAVSVAIPISVLIDQLSLLLGRVHQLRFAENRQLLRGRQRSRILLLVLGQLQTDS